VIRFSVSQKFRNCYIGTYKLLVPIYWTFIDSNSSDKLTSYNGKAITYDGYTTEIGRFINADALGEM